MTTPKKLEAVLTDVVRIARREKKHSGFCIGNTTKVDAQGMFLTPLRNTRWVVAGSVIVYLPHQAEEVARFVDGKVDYIFVDTEKKAIPEPSVYGPKNRGNIERAVRDVVKTSTVLTYKGNDLTVDSIDCLLAQTMNDPVRGMGGKKAAIIGCGNIGSKLALKLVERGAHVVVTRRNKKKLNAIVDALNIIKPPLTVAKVSGTTDNLKAAQNANILIGLTETPIISRAMIEALAPGALIMDGGKGCFSADALKLADERGLTILRVDVRGGFEGVAAMLLETERLLKKTVGRSTLQGIPIVSGGLLGRKEEIVVDNIHRPTQIFGMADGQGDFIRSLSAGRQKKLETLQQIIDRREKALDEVSG